MRDRLFLILYYTLKTKEEGYIKIRTRNSKEIHTVVKKRVCKLNRISRVMKTGILCLCRKEE